MSARSNTRIRKIAAGKASADYTFDVSFWVMYQRILEDAGDMTPLECGPGNHGDLYFFRVQTPHDCLVKVGIAVDAQHRLRSLKSQLPPFNGVEASALAVTQVPWPHLEFVESAVLEGLRDYHAGNEWLRIPQFIQDQIVSAFNQWKPPCADAPRTPQPARPTIATIANDAILREQHLAGAQAAKERYYAQDQATLSSFRSRSTA
jgi:hypothetical protein